MNLEYIATQLNIDILNIAAVIKTGGSRYCTDESHDIDYTVIVMDSDIRYQHLIDKDSNICYFCWGYTYLSELINSKDTRQAFKHYLIMTLSNLNANTVYGKSPIELDILNTDKQYYMNYMKLHYENRKSFTKFNKVSLNRHDYMFLLAGMYYIINNAYILTNDQQDIVNRAHHSIVSAEIKTLLSEFYNISIL